MCPWFQGYRPGGAALKTGEPRRFGHQGRILQVGAGEHGETLQGALDGVGAKWLDVIGEHQLLRSRHPHEEIVELAADAVKLAIEAKGGPDGEQENQLYGALVRFLEGWAG